MLNTLALLARIAKIWSRETKWSSWSSPQKLERHCARRLKRAGWDIQKDDTHEHIGLHARYDDKRVSVACKLDGRLSIFHFSAIQRTALARNGVPVIISAGPIDRFLHNAVIDAGIYLIELDDIERLVDILDEPIDNLRLQPYVRPDMPDSWEILRRPADSGTAS